jgi:hypothetical protein
LNPDDSDNVDVQVLRTHHHGGISPSSVALGETPLRVVSVMGKESPRSTTMLMAAGGEILDIAV